jgi:hypothetical protein
MNSGDKVICIDGVNSILVVGSEYIIDRATENSVCLVNDKPNRLSSYKPTYFSKERFKTLSELRNNAINKILT